MMLAMNTTHQNAKTYHILTYGCQMNEADSERIAGVFESVGMRRAARERDADYIVVNTCSVRQKAEDRVYGKMLVYEDIKRERPSTKIIVTGCMIGKVSRNYKKDNAAAILKRLKHNLPIVDYFMDISNLDLFREQLQHDNVSEELLMQLRSETNYLEVQPVYDKRYKAYVPIMNGCNNFCKFCIVPYSRGREKSRPMAGILDEVARLVAGGAREITLVGQNVNSYKSKEVPADARYQVPFAHLLDEVTRLPGDFRVSFTSPHPKDYHDEVIDIVASSEKMMPWMHVPLQAGNDEVLKAMRRPYTRERYMEIIGKIRAAIPHVALATDIVVGFPGETAAQFEDTLDIVRRARIDMAFIGRFSPREGTEAYLLVDDVSAAEKERRENAINEILIENNRAYMAQFVDKEVRVLVDRVGKIPGEFFGKTDGLKNIKFLAGTDRDLLGQFVRVKVKSFKNWNMLGEFVDIIYQ